MTYKYRLAMIHNAVELARTGHPRRAAQAMAEAYHGIGSPGPAAVAALGSVRCVSCACRRRYTRQEFQGLGSPPGGGAMDDGDGGTLDLRNCDCGSTISALRL